MNNIILEKHTLPVLKSEKLLKRNKLLTIQNINKDFELENSKEYKSITSNLHEDYARIQFKEILTEAIHKGASDIHIEPFEDEIVIRIRVDGQLSKILIQILIALHSVPLADGHWRQPNLCKGIHNLIHSPALHRLLGL